MKRSRWLLYGGGTAALLVAVLVFWWHRSAAKPVPVQASIAPLSKVVAPPVSAGPSAAPSSALTASAPRPVLASEPSPAAPAVFEEFKAWAEKLAAAKPAEAAALLAQGETLAKARYGRMVQMIQQDPEQALARSLPYRLRKLMPASLAGYLEQPVSGRGEFKVVVSSPLPGVAAESHPPEYRVTLGQARYRAYTYGGRQHQPSRRHIPLHGVGLTDPQGRKIMALSADTLRVIEPEESADLAASGQIQPGGACPVCAAPRAGAGQETLADLGGVFLAFDQPLHAAAYGRQLNQAMATFWPSSLTGDPALDASDGGGGELFPPLPPPGHTGGRKGIARLLYMPVLFADDPIPPQSQDQAQATCAYMASVYKENSYGSVDWISSVTPLLRLPYRKAAYADGIANGTPVSVVGDAFAQATALGYLGPYNDAYVLFNSLSPAVNFGGRSDSLLNGSPGALPHELGHSTFGWIHANYIDLSGKTPGPRQPQGQNYPIDSDSLVGHDDVNAPVPMPIGKPQMVVYGDPYDIMGGGGSHFGVIFKNQVNWLTDQRVRFINSSQTNRIYAFDVPRIFDGRQYALRVYKDYDREYWVSYRQLFSANPWLTHGVEVQWKSAAAGNNTLLVDTTYATTYGKTDCGVQIGRTFADEPAYVYITPVAQGGDEPTNKWMDVVVNIGPFPTNRPPTFTLAASATQVNPGQQITLTATAQDPDGDTLAYNWDFGDLSFGPNAPVVRNSWSTSGQYVVRCEVSDMKGGLASAYVVVVVGHPTTYMMSGRVVDSEGNPIQGVRVHNGAALPAAPPPIAEGGDPTPQPPGPSVYCYSYTDTQGYYAIGNIPSGTYTNRAFLYGYKTVPQFAEPVELSSASAEGLDHIAYRLPHVSVIRRANAPELGTPSIEVTVTNEEGTVTTETVLSTNAGGFTILRDGDLSQPLTVFYKAGGTAQVGTDYLPFPTEWVTNETIYVGGDGRLTNEVVTQERLAQITFQPGQSATNLDVIGMDNTDGSGDKSVILSLALATRDIRVTTYLTNAVSTNYVTSNAFYLVTNTYVLLRTTNVSIPGWELLLTGPNSEPVWYQTYPTYVLSGAEATVWLLDDDPPNLPTVDVQAIGNVASETYNDFGMFLFSRNGAPMTTDLTVFFTVGGTASNGMDYVALPSQVTIKAGESFALLPVQAISDLFVEGRETVTLTLEPSATYRGEGTATVTILDQNLPSVILYASDSVAAKTGGNIGRITVARTGDLSEPLVVNYLVSGTAVSGRDFQPLPQQITVPAGSITADILIVPIDNPLAGARTVVIQLADSPAYNLNYQDSASVTIQDTLPIVTLSVVGSATEGGTATFTVTRTGPTNSSLLVYFAVGGSAVEGSDYSPIGTNVLIPAGMSSSNIVISAQRSNDDPYRENGAVFGPETVIIQLLPGPDYNLGQGTGGQMTIGDNDGSRWPEVGFMQRETTVREDVGGLYLLVKCSANPETNMPITFQFRVTGGTAVQGVNYEYGAGMFGLWMGTNTPVVSLGPDGIETNDVPLYGIGRFTHFFAPDPPPEFLNPEDTIGYIPIAILNDGVAAGNKTITLQLLAATNLYVTNYPVFTNVTAGITNLVTNTIATLVPTNVYLGDYLSHTITIVDVGVTTVSVTAEVDTAYEAGQRPGRFVFSRDGPTTAPLTVTYAVAGTAAPGNDYVALTTAGRLGTITIPAGTNQAVLPVVPIDDPEEEAPETVIVAVIAQPGYSGSGVATVTIISDDGTIQFTSSRYGFPEHSGLIHIPIVRSGDTNRQATVEYTLVDRTATNGVDYLGTNGVLVFAPGQVDQQISLMLVDNNIVEPDKVFDITLQNPTGGIPLGGQRQTSVYILNDDVAYQFATNLFTVPENGVNATIAISRIGLTNDAGTVTFFTRDGTATNGLDYTAVRVDVAFAPGQTTQTVLVPIIDDARFEGDETVRLALTNPVPGTYLGTLFNATLLILDDECTITFATNNFAVWEYAGVVPVTVLRKGGTVNPVSVDFYTFDLSASNQVDYIATNGTLSFSGNDWVSATDGSGRLDFQPGESNKTFFIKILDDAIGEGNETFGLALTNLVRPPDALPGATLLGPLTNSVVMILDDELPGNLDYAHSQQLGSGPNGPVYAIALQTDGQAVFGGSFTTVNGTLYNRISRLQSSGVVDPFFNPGFGANGPVYALAVAGDNKIVVGGAFTRMDTANYAGIARLRANGDLDPQFNPGSGVGSGEVRAVAVQADKKIVIGGLFSQINGQIHGNLARLNDDGSVDAGFAVAADGPVYALALQADGKLLVGGAFTNIAGGARQCVARLATNGLLDGSFSAAARLDGPVDSIAVQPDGRIVVGGEFARAAGLPHTCLVRLNDDGTVDSTFDTGQGLKAGLRSLAGLPVPPAPLRMPDLDRIVGGKATTIDQFPYQVAIINYPYNPTNIWNDQFCGGSILADSWILTAAHCMVGQSTNGVAVAVGVTDLTQPQQGTIFRVDKIIIHPGYRASTHVDDVALMHLAEPITFGGAYAAAAVQLVTPADATAGLTATGVMATITGWGNTSGTGGANYPFNLQVGAVPITATSAYAAGSITPDMLMAGFAQGGVDTCQGDSGGPLVVTNGSGTILQAGVTSWGNGCALANYPGVYARVSTFYDWIQSNITGTTNQPPVVIERLAVHAVAVQPDGRILIGGNFTNYDGAACNFFGRVSSNGRLDSVFNTGRGANDIVRALALQPDTAVLIGGDFTTINDIPRNHLARIHGDDQWSPVGVEFVASVFRVSETNGAVQILIRRSGGSTNTGFSVDFATSDLTASNGLDYLGYTNTLTFGPGDTFRTNTIAILDDGMVTGNKLVQLTLFNAPLNVYLGGGSTALLVIEDKEKTIRLSSTNYVVSEAATNAVIEVLREGNLAGKIYVTFMTLPGTATPGLDYLTINTNLVFADGETNKTVLVPVIYDTLQEVQETAFLALTNPINCILSSPSNAVLKIVDVILGLGGVNPAFDPGAGAGSPGRLVRALGLCPDGKILVGGAFTVFDNQPRNYVSRLNLDGSLDLSFDPGQGPNGMVVAVGALPNGKALIGGSFTNVSGAALTSIARLNTNGTLDGTFKQPSLLNAALTSMIVQTNGKTVVGGGFTQPAPFLARIRTDGGPDTGFDVGTGPDAIVHAVCLDSNGPVLQMVIGGAFNSVNGYPENKVARIRVDGDVDRTFIPPEVNDGLVQAVAVDANDRVLIGGSFTTLDGSYHPGLARLNVDGSLDETFNPTFDGAVYALVVQPDGKLLVGGTFTTVNQTNRGRIARLLPDGSLEQGFAAGSGADGTVFSILYLPDNGILIGGGFGTVDGLPRAGVAKLVGDPAPPLRVQPLPGASGQWIVGVNTAPGAQYVYEASQDLQTWTDVTRFTANSYYTVLVDPAAPGYAFRFYRVRLLTP
jgi:uncharacterized delta-60 repeat protein